MSLWILADAAVIALIAFMCCRTMKKGFLKASYAGVASFAAIVLVFSFHIPFQSYIENSVIGDTVRDKIRISVESSIYSNADITNADANAESAKETVNTMKLPGFLTEWINEAIDTQKQSFDNMRDSLTESVTGMIFPYVMQLLSIVLLYVLLRLAMWLIFAALKLVFEIPILGTADKLLGAVVGGINALLIIYAVSALLMLLTPVDKTTLLEQGINSTYLYKYFYYNNIITTIFLG